MKNRTRGPKLMLFVSFFVWLNSLEKGGWPLVLATVGTLGFLIMVIYLQVKLMKENKQKSEIR
jgi:hypothetical protein